MSLTKLTKDLSIISKLSDEPNDTDGLTADELKVKFDEAGNSIKDYLNNTLTLEMDNAIGESYKKPGTGIPKTDLASDVQTSLGKADTAYVKPDTGIPKTDLVSDVQTSLGKADTALQAGALPAGGTDGDVLVKNGATDYDATWKKPQYCRPNLLDNWYFVGGGSQQGDGYFPINQRGQAMYNGSGTVGFDRWYLGGGAFAVYSWGISCSVAGSYLIQHLSDGLKAAIDGKTITLSVLLSNNDILAGTLTYQKSSSSNIYVAVNDYWQLIINTNGDVFLWCANSNQGLLAVKLELGSYQTLAHQENGVWVLNEIPDYGEELLKCQRYFQTFRTEALRPTYGADCRPVMATEQPTKGTITVSGSTIYTLES